MSHTQCWRDAVLWAAARISENISHTIFYRRGRTALAVWGRVNSSVLQCVAGCCIVLHSSCIVLHSTKFSSVLQCVAVCCSVLHCTYNDSQCVAVCCSVLQCVVAVCCRMLRCVAFQIQYCNDVSGQRWWSEDDYNFSVLQCVAVRRSMLQCVAFPVPMSHSMLQCVAVCCIVLQCVALCCIVLQCVAVCCIVLQCVAVYCISHPMFHQRG